MMYDTRRVRNMYSPKKYQETYSITQILFDVSPFSQNDDTCEIVHIFTLHTATCPLFSAAIVDLSTMISRRHKFQTIDTMLENSDPCHCKHSTNEWAAEATLQQCFPPISCLGQALSMMDPKFIFV
jgi:hypothetical protein